MKYIGARSMSTEDLVHNKKACRQFYSQKPICISDHGSKSNECMLIMCVCVYVRMYVFSTLKLWNIIYDDFMVFPFLCSIQFVAAQSLVDQLHGNLRTPMSPFSIHEKG